MADPAVVQGKWKITGIVKLVKNKIDHGHKGNSEKTIHVHLQEAFAAEREDQFLDDLHGCRVK